MRRVAEIGCLQKRSLFVTPSAHACPVSTDGTHPPLDRPVRGLSQSEGLCPPSPHWAKGLEPREKAAHSKPLLPCDSSRTRSLPDPEHGAPTELTCENAVRQTPRRSPWRAVRSAASRCTPLGFAAPRARRQLPERRGKGCPSSAALESHQEVTRGAPPAQQWKSHQQGSQAGARLRATPAHCGLLFETHLSLSGSCRQESRGAVVSTWSLGRERGSFGLCMRSTAQVRLRSEPALRACNFPWA